MLEHLESLLTGTGHELELQTFKLVDQLGGRTLGLRADTTPQAARIDAHLLNREGVTRLCYCGPVLHTHPAAVDASREPLQFGAETFGHPGLEADIEVLELAIDSLSEAGLEGLTVDLADARILRGLFAGAVVEAEVLQELVLALSHKDAAAIEPLTQGFPPASRAAIGMLLQLYGGVEVLQEARQCLPGSPLIHSALDDLERLVDRLKSTTSSVQIGVDLADSSGYAYYSGARFALYGRASAGALARGGRYDEVGAVFGRNRPAVGFSVDLKRLAAALPAPQRPAAVRAPWSDDPALRSAVRRLRQNGHAVICMRPQDSADGDFEFDRELVPVDGRWVLRAL
jgi:ATP phosphoribosyltransferase regulatory subunit